MGREVSAEVKALFQQRTGGRSLPEGALTEQENGLVNAIENGIEKNQQAQAESLWQGVPAELRATLERVSIGPRRVPTANDRQDLMRAASQLRALSAAEQREFLQALEVLPPTSAAGVRLRVEELLTARELLLQQAALAEAKKAAASSSLSTDQKQLQTDLLSTWKDEDLAKLRQQSRDERRRLAERIVAKQSALYTKYQLSHPGETALRMVTGIVDLAEYDRNLKQALTDVANGNANTWKRVAGAVHGLQTLSNETALAALLTAGAAVVAGLSAAPLFPILVGCAFTSLFLAGLEESLLIEAASDTSDPDTFTHHVEEAAQLDAQVMAGVTLMALSEAFHAVINFPKVRATIQAARQEAAALRSRLAVINELRKHYKTEAFAALAEVRRVVTRYKDALSGITDGEGLFTRLAQGEKTLQDLVKIDPSRASEMLASAKSPVAKGALNRIFDKVKGLQGRMEGIVQNWELTLGAEFERNLALLSQADALPQRLATLQELQTLMEPESLSARLRQNAAMAIDPEAASASNAPARTPAEVTPQRQTAEGTVPRNPEVPASGSTPTTPSLRLIYEDNPKHSSQRVGNVSARPKAGQSVLDSSIVYKPTSSRRIGVDKINNEIVIFDEHTPGAFHGHVRAWTELLPEMRAALLKAKLVTPKGKVIRP